MSSKELIIHSTPKGVEVGLLENKKLIEFHQEASDNQFNVGDIYFAKVRKVVPSLNAAFIDVGYKKDGFLHYSDLGPQILTQKIYSHLGVQGKHNTHLLGGFRNEPDIDKSGKIDKVLSRREHILVQVVKEPISTKGPRLTGEVGIPGRTMVLVPFSDFVGVSRKIASAEERKRLKRLISSIKPEGFGVIVRTNAAEKGVAYLHKELEKLLERWKTVVDNLANAKPPERVLSEEGMTRTILRDYVNESLDKIVVDSNTLYDNVTSYLEEIAPKKAGIVQNHSSDKAVFSKYDVTRQIKSAFGQEVKMDSGAYLVIEHTEALHVIDVNSGNNVSNKTDQDEMALRVNMEAADEVARQLRLRDIGGIIIIDFIDMRNHEHRKQVYQRIKKMMEQDKAKHLVLPLTRFGLMQITRQRTKPVMDIKTKELCPSCNGTGKISSTLLIDDELEDAIVFIVKSMHKKGFTIETHPVLAGFLRHGFPSQMMKWMWKYKTKLRIRENENLPLTEFRFFDKEGEEIKM